MGSDLVRSRVAALRLSLLAAAGLVPIACGGAVRGDSNDGTGGSSISGKPGGRAGAGSGPGPVVGVGGSGPIVGTGGSGPIVVGGAGAHFPACTAPELDPATGLVTCQEGYEHRPIAVTCSVPGENAGAPADYGGAGGAGGDTAGLPRADGTDVRCGDDTSVCDAFDLGYCQDSGGGGGVSVCRSGCRSDEDCGTGFICICEAGRPSGGTCLRSDCVTDSDCGPGYRCASYDVGCGDGGFACQSAADQCTGAADCSDGNYCAWGFEGDYRTCDGLVCGRPFLVGGAARLAQAQPTSAWSESGHWTPNVGALATAERQALAEHWTRMGRMEHASIAAFARFALQLLSLGAPPELIEDSTRALADETAHAKLCFELASAYAGQAIGPGPLDVAGSLDVTMLGDIVDLVVLEGCFGETNAALEALESARTADDPVIAAAYGRIAQDEQRHAELAFRFVRWALERDPLLVRDRLRAVLICPPTNDACAEDLVVPVLYALLRHATAKKSRELAA